MKSLIVVSAFWTDILRFSAEDALPEGIIDLIPADIINMIVDLIKTIDFDKVIVNTFQIHFCHRISSQSGLTSSISILTEAIYFMISCQLSYAILL
jgi:hypothetical protein